jgi:hypothetical protein
MQILAGVIILVLYSVCVYGLIDIFKQIKKIK